MLWDELSDQQFNSPGLYTNQATGQNERDAAVDAILDENEMFKHVYETWGLVEFEFVQASSTAGRPAPTPSASPSWSRSGDRRRR